MNAINTNQKQPIHFTHAGQAYKGEVLEICKSSLTVRMTTNEKIPPFQLGTVIDDLCLNVNGQEAKELRAEISQLARHQEYLQLSFCCRKDKKSKAILWQISHQLPPTLQSQPEPNISPLPKIPARGRYTEEARRKRLAFIRAETKAELSQVANTSLNPKELIGNIEGLIGSVEVPVGVAGPLLIKGKNANGIYYAPMATTEGALVASATRGAKAVSLAGGVKTRVLSQRMMRVPLFVLGNMDQALFFADWLNGHYEEIAEHSRQYSNYADLKELKPQVMGKRVHVHFIYETGDAAGQNMTTTCTWECCRWIIDNMSLFDHITIENFLIDANLSNDKKVTYNSFLNGRGIRVIAETVIPAQVSQRVLKVTPKQLVQAYHEFVTGSIAAGMVGIHINFPNMVAAIFTATGQDIACVHESSIGQLHLELTENNEVYASAILPSLILGTVGGGTSLPQQRECLEIMGCAGPSLVNKLSEIIAGFCLALDLSTLSAIASDQFARAHEKLGRNRPVEWLKLADFNQEFFAKALQNHYQSPAITVQQVEPQKNVALGSSIITELTSHNVKKKPIGHFCYHLTYTDPYGQEKERDIILKVKPLDDEVILMLDAMAAMCHPGLASEHHKFKEETGFKKCHVRELAVMTQTDPRFTRHAPIVVDVYQEPEREAYVLVQEYLSDMLLMDSADDISGWTAEYIFAAIEGIAAVHSIWYQREEELKEQSWLGQYPTRENMVEKKPLWKMLAIHAAEEFPEWFTQQELDAHLKIVEQLDEWWARLDTMPKTLIHNDFNPRNIAFRRSSRGAVLCAYDWELATLHLPQHDLAELLAFTLTDKVSQEEVKEYLDYHRKMLEQASGTKIGKEQWLEGYQLCLLDLMVNRIAMYLMAHTFRHYNFMERVLKTARHLLSLCQKIEA